MIQNLSVGPPVQGFSGTPTPTAGKSPLEDKSGSFAKTLGDREKPKVEAPPPKDRSDRSEVRRKKESEDPPEKNSQVRAQETESPGKKKAATTRDQEIRKFMDSFESEFGTPPEKIVEAMALLKPEDLTKAPEETADVVVSKLDLDPEDEQRAQAMYAGLLMNLRAIDQSTQPPKFAMEQGGMTTPVMQERFLAVQEKKAAVNQGLDRLNQKFWLKDQTSQLAGNEATEGLEQGAVGMANGDATKGLEGLTQKGNPALNEAAALKNAGPSDQPELSKLLTDLQKSIDALGEKGEAVAAEEMSGEDGDDAAPMSTKVSTDSRGKANEAQGEKALTAAVAAPAARHQSEQRGQGQSEFSGKSAEGKSSSKSSSKEESSIGDFKSALSGTPQPLKLDDVAAALKAAAPASPVAAALVMNKGDHEANVQQVLSQAQYLIKRGGGEVNVQMNPEGLGQINMKVLVQDGKVNVQMATETAEAKKAIESSLSELRSGLAAHKLSVDHVKVDVVASTNTDNNSRNDTNMNQNPQRDSARQFWNQFQDNFGNRGARESFFDGPALKNYRQGTRPEALQPMGPSTASVRATEDGRGSGLNLVA